MYISILDVGYWIYIQRERERERNSASLGPGGPKRLYKAPTDNTKPQQTIQSPNRQYKAPKDYTKPLNIRQNPEILNKDLKY